MSSTVKAVILAVVADGLTLAVSFGVSISQAQQDAILAFVGVTTTALALAVSWYESREVTARATVQIAGHDKLIGK
jgi:hypothetical protein